jgi:hypothetical protein
MKKMDVEIIIRGRLSTKELCQRGISMIPLTVQNPVWHLRLQLPCVSPQIGGQLYDLCSIIAPISYYFKQFLEKD